MKILGLITARCGSKGIPGKNIKILGHRPLISYVIEDAKNSNLLDKVVVSTDCYEIAQVARKFGGEVPFLRPEELARDNTPSIEVVKHVLNFYENQNIHYDAVCLLQPTSPFKPEGFIDACIKKFQESKADSLISVLEVPHEYNPHWTFKMSSEGILNIATGESRVVSRRQDLPKAYHRDGSVYITSSKEILNNNTLIGGETVGMVSDINYYANLDTMSDWNKAEKLYKKLYPCVE